MQVKIDSQTAGMSSGLRVIAVSSPEYPQGTLGRGVLKSRDPASLFNACRYAAYLAEQGIGAWGESNWALGRKNRRSHLLLMHSLENELSDFMQLLETVSPNLLLIGAMSIAFPGAIACARYAKERFSDRICVVLGGWHATETIYRDAAGVVAHHPGSPVRQMAEGIFGNVFDLVVAGQAEYLIAWIGEQVASLERRWISPASIYRDVSEAKHVPGKWILSWMKDRKMHALIGAGSPLSRNALPAPCRMFGVQSSFDVFGGRLTAHVFSDTGNGCAFDCMFCSERRSLTGPLSELAGAPERLFSQLRSAVEVVREDTPAAGASAFIEDSTMLAGSKSGLRRLADLLGDASLDLRFGGQLTLDQILGRVEILRDLKAVGLDYLFVGIETSFPELIGGLSKDVGRLSGRWLDRTEKVLEILSSLGIQCGAAILFGLGETHQSRLKLLAQLVEWRKRFAAPNPVSMNWAVQHPLMGLDGGTGYRYERWGIPDLEWIEAFRDFGEASLLYPLAGQPAPILAQIQEVAEVYEGALAPPVGADLFETHPAAI